MNKAQVLLIALPAVAVMITLFYFHFDIGRKMIIRKVIAQLNAWIPVSGTVEEIDSAGGAGSNKYWHVSYTFRLDDGIAITGKAGGSTVIGKPLPYYSGQQIDLLVNPNKPEHSALIDDLRKHSFMQLKSGELKSSKQVQIEFAIDCLVVLASAAGAIVLDAKFSATHGAFILFYLFVAFVMFALGMLQMINYTPGKLFDANTPEQNNK